MNSTNAMNEDQNQQIKALSKWWILLHIWGGLCFKGIFDGSGISNVIRDSGNQTFEIGILIFTAFSILLFSIGYLLSKYLVEFINKKRLIDKSRILLLRILPAAYFLVSFIFVYLLSPVVFREFILTKPTNQISKYKQPTNINKNTPTNIHIEPITVITTNESAMNLKEEDLNIETLKAFEILVVDTFLDNLQEKQKKYGIDIENNTPDTEVNSKYIQLQSMKLALINFRIEKLWTVTVIGINGDSLDRIVCFRLDEKFSAFSGECGKEIEKVFGIRTDIMNH